MAAVEPADAAAASRLHSAIATKPRKAWTLEGRSSGSSHVTVRRLRLIVPTAMPA